MRFHAYLQCLGFRTLDVLKSTGFVLVENAVFLTRMKVGSPAKSITAGVYASNAFWDRSLSQTDGTIHVMTETCFPIFYAMEGTDPGGTNRMVSFVVGDFKESIHSQSVFQKPKECK